MADWIAHHAELLWWLASASAVAFVGTLAAVPWMVVRIPADYFSRPRRARVLPAGRHPVLAWAWLLPKNLLGGVFIVAGALMLFLPGQGVLTILIGVLLLDFPGKFRFERWLVVHPPLARTVVWLRRRAGAPRWNAPARPLRWTSGNLDIGRRRPIVGKPCTPGTSLKALIPSSGRR